MENNKYYDLIIELIKENNKFPGHEDILNDIAEDVYNHAKVVLNSVTNEDVVSAYLEKVISTSIITVSKKLNKVSRSRSSGAVDAIVAARKAAAEARTAARKAALLEREKHTVNTELVDKMINGPETSGANIESETETPAYEEKSFELQEPNIQEEIPELIAEEEQEPVITEAEEFSSQENENDTLAEEVLTPTEELSIGVNETLEESVQEEVEPLDEIQDIPVFEEDNTETIEIPEETKDIQESFISESDSEDIQPDSIAEITLPEETDNILAESEIDDSVDLAETEAPDDLIPEQQADSLEIMTPELIETEALAEEPESLVEDNNISFQEDTELDFAADTEVEELSLESSVVEDLEPVELNNSFEEAEDEKAEETLQSEPAAVSANGPDYSLFDFDPSTFESVWNENDVTEALDVINKKEPDSNVFELYKLRYNKGYTVEEICKELNQDKEKVIDTLIEISLLVKE